MNSISEIPVELLFQILSYLDTKNIFKARVSKQFESIITDNYLWSKYGCTFETIRDSAQLVGKITRALESPIKIYDCHSTKITITTRNDVLFDDASNNSTFPSEKVYHIYDGNLVTDFNNELHQIFFNGEYYNDWSNKSIYNLYTGRICSYCSPPGIKQMCVGTSCDLLLIDRHYDNNKLIMKGFDVDNNLIYEKILDYNI